MSVRAYIICIITAISFIIAPACHALELDSDIEGDYTSSKSGTFNISARVKPRPFDYKLDLTSNIEGTVVGADQDITYTITYGSLLSYGTPMTITATWSQGTVQEEQLQSFNIVEYVAGSATHDYWGNAKPVVDIAKRSITWTTSRFPPNTIDKKLYFTLKTPGRYVTDKQVNFSVSVSMKTEEMTITPVTLNQVYSPTEFIKKEVSGVRITSLDIRRITDTSFAIYLTATLPVRATLYWGETEDLTESITDNELSDTKVFVVKELRPATTYYFKILIENSKGIQRKTPEFFQVTTASTSLVSLIDQERLFFTSQGVVLKNERGLGDDSHILIPEGKQLDVYLPFKANPPSTVYLSLVNRSVMGSSTDEQTIGSLDSIRLLETQPLIYTGRLPMPVTTGSYDLAIKAQDADGSINQDVLTNITVSQGFQITNSSGIGIEKAIVYLEKYNTESKLYEYFPAQSFGFTNPSYSDRNGFIPAVLPRGEYTANVHALWHKPYQGTFVFNPESQATYPQITLSDAPFSFTSVTTYYWESVIDNVMNIVKSTDAFASSRRSLDASLAVSLIVLAIFSFYLNLRRVKLSFEGLIISIEKRIQRIIAGQTNSENIMIGFIEDNATGLPVHNATVYIIARAKKSVIDHDITNSIGQFHLHVTPATMYDLVIKKLGYVSEKIPVAYIPGVGVTPGGPFSIDKELSLHKPNFVDFLYALETRIFAGISDTLLFSLGFIHLLFLQYVGFAKLFPVTIITALNAFLWLEYQYEKWKSASKTQ